MSIEIREVAKEYLMNVRGVKQTVKARISHGELSNFYR